MKFINELRESDKVRDIYLCKSVQLMKTKAGKPYMTVMLMDKTGTLDGKIWEVNSSGIEDFEALDYVYTEGEVTIYNSAPQLKITRVRKCHEGEYDPSNYMPSSDKSIDEMFDELMKLADRITNPYIKALVEYFFKDEEFVEKFKNHSAAKTVHHGFIGGLLEHTLSVTKTCGYFAVRYPILNSDIIIAAAMLHDIGKVEELSSFPENDYTDAGNLLGHIIIGTRMISNAIDTITGFPETLSIELQHCIVAHHGKMEFGSPKTPSLAEAVALNFADDLDAKMQAMKEILNNADDKAVWLGKQWVFDNNNMRRTSID